MNKDFSDKLKNLIQKHESEQKDSQNAHEKDIKERIEASKQMEEDLL